MTLVMIGVDGLSISSSILIPVLLAAMLFKACLIGWEFMHLREEPRSLGFLVAFSLLFFGAILFILVAPDGLRILHDVPP